jgi:hypothetical protein
MVPMAIGRECPRRHRAATCVFMKALVNTILFVADRGPGAGGCALAWRF